MACARDKFPSDPYFQVIKITADIVEGGKIPFRFEGIKKGEYCIIAYQDKNKDGQIDKLVGGQIAEPLGRYKEPVAWASWQEISFKLEDDLSDVEISIADSLFQKSQ